MEPGQREEMVPQPEETLNTIFNDLGDWNELLETLEDWNNTVNSVDVDNSPIYSSCGSSTDHSRKPGIRTDSESDVWHSDKCLRTTTIEIVAV